MAPARGGDTPWRPRVEATLRGARFRKDAISPVLSLSKDRVRPSAVAFVLPPFRFGRGARGVGAVPPFRFGRGARGVGAVAANETRERPRK